MESYVGNRAGVCTLEVDYWVLSSGSATQYLCNLGQVTEPPYLCFPVGQRLGLLRG